MNPEQLEQLQILAGPEVQSLLQSREATEEHLSDPNPKMRWSAVILLTHHWGPTEQFKLACEELASHDTDPLVRSKAIGCLGTWFARTANRRIEKLLAGIICDNSESYEVRRSAYTTLCMVNGDKSTPTPNDVINLRIPEDIDWTFVNSMLE